MFGVSGFRSPPRRLTAALAGAAAALLVSAAVAPAGAQAVTLNFNSLTDTTGASVRTVGNCYTESGFTVTAHGLGCGVTDAFATGTPSGTLFWTGSPALFLNNPGASSVDFTRSGGGTFSIQSIGLAPFLGAGGSVLFTGLMANGMSVTQTFTVPDGSFLGAPTLSTFTFSGFTDLESLSMAASNTSGEPTVQFDDVMMTPTGSVVPEPTTVALLAGGLVGTGLFARTRGARRRNTSAGV